VNEYETKAGGVIYHFDCYRMRSEEEAYDIGLEEYLDSGHLCLIEWSEKIPSLIPAKFLKIEINLYNSTNRHFLVTQNG
jgi:tRNA threonylcarbamoyladenosine biosynthesis protein TsaE